MLQRAKNKNSPGKTLSPKSQSQLKKKLKKNLIKQETMKNRGNLTNTEIHSSGNQSSRDTGMKFDALESTSSRGRQIEKENVIHLIKT